MEVGEDVVSARCRYHVRRKLGEGGFGAVYDVQEAATARRFAMKVERVGDRSAVLKMEVDVLKRLERVGGRHFCRFFDRGANERVRFIVMTLVGQSLSELRRACPNHRLTIGTAVGVSVQCLEAIEDLHKIGYLHRDLKPGNFAVGREEDDGLRKVYVLDFGMCRSFLNERGEIRTPRERAGFRGTVRYAPLNCHDEVDLGRKDDLESWFYMLLEFTSAELPWTAMRDKGDVGRAKRDARTGDKRLELLADCPRIFGRVIDYVNELKYWDKPDYDFIYKLMARVLEQRQISALAPYDWERGGAYRRATERLPPPLLDPDRSFTLLSYMCANSIKAQNFTVVIDLMEFLSGKLPTNDVEGSFTDSHAVVSAMFLLSACFDVAVAPPKTGDRWSFLSGEFAQRREDGDATARDWLRDPRRKYIPKKQANSKVKWVETAAAGAGVMEEHFHKTLQFAEDIKNYVGAAGGALPSGKVKSKDDSTKLSGRSHNLRKRKTERRRSKSHAHRLRLPAFLCLPVARGLVGLFVDTRDYLDNTAALLAAKLAARVCQASCSAIGLTHLADEEGIRRLVALALNERRCAWVRHGAAALLLDALECEQRAVTRAAERRAAAAPRRLPSSMSAALPSPSSTSSGAPETPADAQQAIEATLATLSPASVPACAIPTDFSYVAPFSCNDSIRSGLAAGQPFSFVRRCVKSSIDTEKKLASSSTDTQLYQIRVQKVVQLQAGSGAFASTSFDWPSAWTPVLAPSSSASSLLPATWAAYNSPIPPPVSYSHLSGVGRGSFGLLPVADYGAPATPDYAANKEALSKLCEQIQMSKQGGLNVFMAGSTPPPTEVLAAAASSAKQKSDSAAAAGGDARLGDDASESDSAPLADADETLLDVSASSSVDASAARDEAEIRVEMEARRHLGSVQPAVTSLGKLVESEHGWSAWAACQRALMLDDTLFRVAHRDLAAIRKPTGEMPPRDTDALPLGHPDSLVLLEDIVSHLLIQIEPTFSVNYVERLLDLFWQLLSCVYSCQRQTPPPFEAAGEAPTPLSLSEPALNSLITFMTWAPELSEHIWLLTLQILKSSVGYKITQTVNNESSQKAFGCENFRKMMHRFVRECTAKFSQISMVCPSVVERFGHLLQSLHQSPSFSEEIRRRICADVLDVIIESISNQTGHSSSSYSTDVLGKLADLLLSNVQLYQTLPVDDLARLFAAVATFSLSFLSKSRAPLSAGAQQQFVLAASVLPRQCFSCCREARADDEHPWRQDGGAPDGLVARLLAFCDELCAAAEAPPVFDCVLIKYPSSVQHLLSAVSLCTTFGAEQTPADAQSWRAVSVGDWTLQLLVKMSRRAADGAVLLQLLLDHFLSMGHDRSVAPKLSPVAVWYLKNLLNTEERLQRFCDLGGIRVVCEQLVASISSSATQADGANAQLMRRLASVSQQVRFGATSDRARRPEVKTDGLVNFAPQCQIASSSPMAHHLSALLAAAPPHRRARTATWSYQFYPAEVWLDLTITLPFPILLSEVHIKAHMPTLNTAPAAVQVELASSSCATSHLIGPPVQTAGCSKIRISTLSFESPVQIVKLHLRRPVDSANLSLAQILLLGQHSVVGADSWVGGKSDFVQWLVLLNHFIDQGLLRTSWRLPSSLLAKLVSLYLRRSLQPRIYARLSTILQRCDSDVVSSGRPADLIFAYISSVVARRLSAQRWPSDSGESVFAAAIPWLADLLFACANANAQTAVELLGFIERCVGQRPLPNEPVVAHFVWVAACLVWNDASLNEFASDAFTQNLCELAVDRAVATPTRTAAEWLLCSFSRHDAALIGAIVKRPQSASSAVTDLTYACTILRRAALSAEAAANLLESGLLQTMVAELGSLCRGAAVEKPATTAATILSFLAEMCQMRAVRDWLLTDEAPDFLEPLLKQMAERGALATADVERALVLLVQRCVAHSEPHRTFFSTALCRLLKSSSCGLSSPLQQILLNTLLEDETLTVVVVGQPDDSAPPPDKLWHPSFGCSRHRDVRAVSIYSTCSSLVRAALRRRDAGESSTASLVATDSDSLSTTSVGTSTAFGAVLQTGAAVAASLASALHTGERAKSRRLSARTAYQAQSQLQAAASVLRCPQLPNVSRLPGNVVVGQLFAKVAAVESFAGPEYVELRNEKSSSTDSETCDAAEFGWSMPASTLEVFAKLKGLALLAQHLQLYQPILSVQAKLIPASASNTAKYNLSNPMMALAAAAAHKQSGSYDSPVEDYLPDYDYDFEFIDWPTAATGGGSFGQAFPNMLADVRTSGRLQGVVSAGLSPHVVVAFSVFLRLNGYAELLVTQDRHKAMRLLRLTMGLPATVAYAEDEGSETDAEALSLLAFSVLRRLFELHEPQAADGRVVRSAAFDLGVVEMLLLCVGAFAHQPAVSAAQLRDGGAPPDCVALVEQLLRVVDAVELSAAAGAAAPSLSTDERGQQYWAKGTGFGTGTTQQQWNVDLHALKRRRDEQTVTCLLKVLASFVFPLNWELVAVQPPVDRGEDCLAEDSGEAVFQPAIVAAFARSSLLSILASYLRNDSVLDISRHVSVYESVMQLIAALAHCPSLRLLLLDGQPVNVGGMLVKFLDCIRAYLSKLNLNSSRTSRVTFEEPLEPPTCTLSDPQSSATSALATEMPTTTTPTKRKSSPSFDATEEGLMKLIPLVEFAANLMARHLGRSTSESADCAVAYESSASLDERYMAALRPLQYVSLPFLKTGGAFAFAYHYESAALAARGDGAASARTRRLAQEAVTLAKSLPLSASSGVFVRAAEERLDVMKVLITGPADTPYANGCFEFDVWFPLDYPQSPMHINLQTTGGHSVRFNPNLYNDGKVCLSVLNTWHGRPEERWHAQTSSFLQVLVSIQSLILVAEPYFNEPGYERSRNTPAGQQAAREYDANIRQASVRWAMLEMIRRPPPPFADVVRHHFWLKRDEICRQLDAWIADMESDDPRVSRALGQHVAAIKRHYQALKDELAKLENPFAAEAEARSVDA